MTARRPVVALVAALALAIGACGDSTSAQEECVGYLVGFTRLVVPAGDVLLQRAEDFREYEAGEILLDDLSQALASSAAEMDALLEEIDDLGQAPDELSEGVALVVEGVDLLRDAFELDSGLGFATDPALLEQYGAMTREGVDLINEGTGSLGTCPTT